MKKQSACKRKLWSWIPLGSSQEALQSLQLTHSRLVRYAVDWGLPADCYRDRSSEMVAVAEGDNRNE